MKPSVPDPDSLRGALRAVMDPELDCNIVDLGLVRDVSAAGDRVTVRLTPTTAACPMVACLADGIARVLLGLPGVGDVEVVVADDPPWNPGMMTPAGRRRLGMADTAAERPFFAI